MNVPPPHSLFLPGGRVHPAAAPAAPAAAGTDAKKLRESAQQFEAILLRQVLGEALKPAPATPHGQPAPGAEIYQSFLTDAVADGISRSGALGLAPLFQHQLMSREACPPPVPKPSP